MITLSWKGRWVDKIWINYWGGGGSNLDDFFDWLIESSCKIPPSPPHPSAPYYRVVNFHHFWQKNITYSFSDCYITFYENCTNLPTLPYGIQFCCIFWNKPKGVLRRYRAFFFCDLVSLIFFLVFGGFTDIFGTKTWYHGWFHDTR